jgi:hypothetical protein
MANIEIFDLFSKKMASFANKMSFCPNFAIFVQKWHFFARNPKNGRKL